jgi:hypothetical protein
MPKGPRGETRPGDVIGAAVLDDANQPGKRGPYKKAEA